MSGVSAAATRTAITVDRPVVDPEAPPVEVERVTDLRLLVPVLVAWGLVAALLGWPGWVAGAVLVVVGGGAAVGVARRGRLGTAAPLVTLTCVATMLVVVALFAWTAVRESGPVRELAQERAVVTLVATVATDPHPVAGGAGGAGSRPFVVVTLDVHEVTGRGLTTRVQSPVLLIGPPALMGLRWHERVRLVGRLGPTDDPADDVVAIADSRGAVEVLARPGVVDRVAETVRARFAEATAGLPTDARGLLPGLVIGDTTRTPPDLTAAMQATGMTHLSAVSGSNVSFVLGAALWLCGWLGVGRAVAAGGRAAAAARFRRAGATRAERGASRRDGVGRAHRAQRLPPRPGRARPGRRRGRPPGLGPVAVPVVRLRALDPGDAAGCCSSRCAGRASPGTCPTGGRGSGRRSRCRWRPRPVCGRSSWLLQGSCRCGGPHQPARRSWLVAPATVVGVATAALSVVSPTLASWLAWSRPCPLPGHRVDRPGGRPGAGRRGGRGPREPEGRSASPRSALGVVLAGPWMIHHG